MIIPVFPGSQHSDSASDEKLQSSIYDIKTDGQVFKTQKDATVILISLVHFLGHIRQIFLWRGFLAFGE